MKKDDYLIFEAYSLKGIASGKSLEDIAKKHNTTVDNVKKCIEIGSKIEHEHTGNEEAAKKIATDHVYEDLEYYSKLKKIETKSENEETLHTHEEVAAHLPQDIQPGREGEMEILNKAAPILAQLAFSGDIKRANRLMYYDEDFNQDLVSAYRYYQKNGFPQTSRTISAKDYANEMETDYTSQKLKDEEAESYGMPDSEFKKLKLKKDEIKIKKPSKELPQTHPVIHDLAKQKYRELHSNEDAEGKPLTPYQQKIKDNDLKRRKNNEYNWINSFHRTFGPGYKEELEKAGLDPYAMYVDYYGGWHNESAVKKFADIYNNKYPDYPVDVEKLLNLMQQSKEKPREGFKSEQEERRIDPKCWKGYHKQGTKLKNGVRVNNCVKNS